MQTIPTRPSCVFPLLAALLCAAGCMNAPIPATPIPVQPAPIPPAAPAPTAVTGVDVRVSPTSPAADKTRALLIVQQHGGSTDTGLTLQQLGDWLATALGSDAFSVVNPHDVIGTAQNVGPWGEYMPAASATELASKIGTPVLLTASVTDVRLRNIGGTDPGVEAVLEFTLSAKGVPGGELQASVNATARSKKQPSLLSFRQNAADLWSGVAKEGAYGAAPALCKAWREAAGKTATVAPVRAFFASNVPGSVVRLDGVAYGTIGAEPLAISVTPGMHNLEIAYPGMEPFQELAMIQEGSSFVTVLSLTDASAAAAKQDAYFQTVMDRAQKSGLTDDLVREIIAKGYAQYLSASHAKIEGMPQTLQTGGPLPSLGLNPVSPARPVDTPTTAELLQKAASQLQ